MGDRLTHLLPRIGFGSLVAAAFLVPVVYTRSLVDSFALPKATISWVATIVAVAGVAVWAASRRAWPIARLRILVPLGVLIGWTALATVVSHAPLVSVLGQYGRYDGLVALLTGAAAALSLVAYVWRDPARLEAVVWAVVAGGTVSLVVVVAQRLGWAWTDWSVAGLPPLAVVGLAGNPNFSGAMLALVVPFVLGLRSQQVQPVVRAVLVVAVAALCLGVAWTGTRGGLLALLAGAAAFGFLAPDLLPKVVRFAAAGALVVGLGAVLLSSVSDSLPGSQQAESSALLESRGLGQRQNVWAGAATMIRHAPLVGVGPDAFGLRFPYERSARPLGRALIVADEAHDTYLDRAATAGLPALGAYLWLVGTVVVFAWRARRRVAAEHRWLLAAFGGAFAGYLVQGLFSIDMVPLAFASWLCIGALVGLTDPASLDAREGGAPEPEARPVPVPALVGVLAVVVLALAIAVRPVMADRHARAGITALASEEPLEAYGEFAAASSWLGHEPSYHQRQGAALVALAAAPDTDPDLRRSLLDEALLAYGHALDRAPGDVPTLEAQAETHLLAAEAASTDESADAHLASAMAIYRRLFDDLPADQALHLPYGRALEVRARLGSGAAATEDRERAAEQFELALGYLPDRLAAYRGLARLAVDDGRLSEARAVLADARKVFPDEPELDAAIESLDRRIEADG